MPTKAEIIIDLDRIIKNIDDKHKARLTHMAAQDAYVAIKALKYIVNNLDTLSTSTAATDFLRVKHNDITYNVPIHLHNYDVIKLREPRKEAILNALPIAFINAYRAVETGRDTGVMTLFLSKLGGHCIDAKVTGAIDFSATCNTKPLTFTDQISSCADKAGHKYKEQSYFSVFLALYHEKWEKPYSRDIALSSPCQVDGVFDASSFEVMTTFLNMVYSYEEDKKIDQWLKESKVEGKECKSVFLRFLWFSAIKYNDANTIEKYGEEYSDQEVLKIFDLIAEGTEIVSALKDRIHRIAVESEDVAIKVRAIVLIARIAPLGAVGYAEFVHNVGDNFQNYGKIIKSILASEIAEHEKSIIMAAFFAKIKQLIQASFADPVEAPQDNEQVRALFNLFIINNLGATPFMVDCDEDVKRKVNDRLLQLARDSEMQGKPLREARSAYCAAQEIMGEDDARRYEKRVSSFKNKNDSAIEKIRLKSAELEQRNQTDAEDAINALIASLDENYDQYFTKESMDLETYQHNINEAISRARDVLEIHRGKKQIIAHIAVGVITGGVGLAAAMVINKLVTNRFSLFKTDSEKKLNRLRKTISSECSRKGIAVR